MDPDRREQAVRLFNELCELAVVDWIQKQDIQRQMRQAVKRSLRGSSLSREVIDALTAKVLDLARTWLVRP